MSEWLRWNGGKGHWKCWLKAQEVRVLNDSTTWC